MRLKLAALAIALGAATASAATADKPAPAAPLASPAAKPPPYGLPGTPAYVVPPPHYDQAPEPWRSYLLQAREADKIADPLQRCLAFPPIPGSQWPANLIPAHCQYTFGLGDFSLATVKARLDKGDVAGLEDFYRKLQDKHFSDSDFSEHIHSALEVFDSSYESGVVSKRWLEAAPASPFAMVARAEFYQAMGWAARGAAYAQETPDEQIARMREYHDKARALYEQALKLEPKLMPAYVGLVHLDFNGDSTAAFEIGRRVDPGCKPLMSMRMSALRPRWGGSYPRMVALELQILPQLPKRPLLALSRIWSYEDVYDLAYKAEKYDLAVEALKPMVAVSSSPQIYEDLATAMFMKKDVDPWERLSYSVQITRFRPGDAWNARERAHLQLTLANDAEGANRSAAAAVAAEPENGYGHYLYAGSFNRLGKVDEAEREYLLALEDEPEKSKHRDALFELGDLMVRAHRTAKARAYADQAIKDFPEEGRAWLLNWLATGMERVPLATLREAVQKFLAKADPNDPRMAHQIEEARKGLAYLNDFEATHGDKP
jgi:tetratricopeptide (TPR) repeat protein